MNTNAIPEEQAVLIHLDGVNLPDEVYENHDLATLEDQLIDMLEASRLGDYGGHEFGEQNTTVYLYGPSADAIFDAIEPILADYPLCENARVVLRNGGPTAPQREVRIMLSS